MEQLLNQAFGGMQLKDNANADAVANLLDKFGLRWKVSKQRLQLPDGTPTQFYGVLREDTNVVLQSCKDSYVPYQNSELAELLITISSKTGYEISNGGDFKDGAKVYLQLKTGNSIPNIGKNHDKVNGFITGINSHDGSISLRWGLSNITISCQNTFNAASRQLTNKARHTNSMHNRIDQHLREIGLVIEEEKSLFDQFIKLSEVPVTKRLIAKVIKNITDVDTLDKNYKEEDYSTYQLNRTTELLTSVSSEMEQKGETLWGLFSGVTHYTSHVMPVPNRSNSRAESKYVGSGSRFDNEVLSMLMHELN